MKAILYMLIMAACVPVRAQKVLVLKGEVLDEHGAAMPGATVFLGSTRYVTTSDTGGHFRITHLKPGNYKVIAKVVGYKPLVKNIELHEQDLQLTLQLEPDAKYLKSVTVRPDKSWLDHLELFKQQFLGESDNAGQCKVINPGALNFTYDKRTGDLSADADDLLVIENRQLGYQLRYVLLQFDYSARQGSVVYAGYPSFQELHGAPDEETQWKANRRAAYLGSIQHFIRSVYDQNSKAEGFMVYKIRNRAPFGFPNTSKGQPKLDHAPISFDSLLTTVAGHGKLLEYSDALYVIYTRGKEPLVYTMGHHSLAGLYGNRRLPEGQVSIVNGLGPVTLYENGVFMPTNGLYFEGYMGWEKVGDLVPFDYDPTLD